ncbi:hypothetical protein KP626_06620 [Christensenella sp. MSJ-20]|uniref:hypothetical protein n=1 Tax=Christensenella sp. MSJ-20 TaxID=2841518 RepID=UPI001C763173|nr:hypothetical protein KP626_06620 [Christensenella sp. MSJ-20]
MDNPVDVFADHPQGEAVIRRRENPLFDYPLFVDREEQGIHRSNPQLADNRATR